jgi:hypothetical protein
MKRVGEVIVDCCHSDPINAAAPAARNDSASPVNPAPPRSGRAHGLAVRTTPQVAAVARSSLEDGCRVDAARHQRESRTIRPGVVEHVHVPAKCRCSAEP